MLNLRDITFKDRELQKILIKTLSCHFTKMLVCFLHIVLIDNHSLNLKLIIITSTPPLSKYQCSLAPLR